MENIETVNLSLPYAGQKGESLVKKMKKTVTDTLNKHYLQHHKTRLQLSKQIPITNTTKYTTLNAPNQIVIPTIILIKPNVDRQELTSTETLGIK